MNRSASTTGGSASYCLMSKGNLDDICKEYTGKGEKGNENDKYHKLECLNRYIWDDE